MQHFEAAGFQKWFLKLLQHLRDTHQVRQQVAGWAAEQGIGLLSSTVAQVASFLFSLIESHGLLPQGLQILYGFSSKLHR